MEAQRILISIGKQTLRLLRGGAVVRTYAVSTALNGAGEQSGSGCTPRGAHYVRAKIGAGCALGTVFVGRRPTGEVFTRATPDPEAGQEPDRILSRILWLCGREPGRNRLGRVDTMARFIYIHGCPDYAPMGVPLSHGCVRMRNADVIALFDQVEVGVEVMIEE